MSGSEIVPWEHVQSRILVLRGARVIIDADLAALYGVPTFRLNEAVKRNVDRFPADFRFQLTGDELGRLTSQFAISKPGRGGRRTLPFLSFPPVTICDRFPEAPRSPQPAPGVGSGGAPRIRPPLEAGLSGVRGSRCNHGCRATCSTPRAPSRSAARRLAPTNFPTNLSADECHH